MVLYRFIYRQIRAGSAMLRAYKSDTRAMPYESLTVADVGDVNVYEAYRTILATGFIHLTIDSALWVSSMWMPKIGPGPPSDVVGRRACWTARGLSR
ncbi:agmatinase, mitochondrial-like [Oncorhynchus tshawytscha]|uniref:agmatinase, mitochondrial-like n=1 Tax=Oncorhynchus tshawytscha TaxID=74940 RepID=UPI001C3C4BCD|nr:agmatinase, mitochondrial-like [Oncorhynchus tshawytscha]